MHSMQTDTGGGLRNVQGSGDLRVGASALVSKRDKQALLRLERSKRTSNDDPLDCSLRVIKRSAIQQFSTAL
jgi:hypothetical protein